MERIGVPSVHGSVSAGPFSRPLVHGDTRWRYEPDNDGVLHPVPAHVAGLRVWIIAVFCFIAGLAIGATAAAQALIR